LLQYSISEAGELSFPDKDRPGQWAFCSSNYRDSLTHLLHWWSVLQRVLTWLLCFSEGPLRDELVLPWLVLLRKFWVLGQGYPQGHLSSRRFQAGSGYSAASVSPYASLLLHLEAFQLSNIATCISMCLMVCPGTSPSAREAMELHVTDTAPLLLML